MTNIVTLKGAPIDLSAPTPAENLDAMESRAKRLLKLEAGKSDDEAYRSIACGLYGLLIEKERLAPHSLAADESECIHAAGERLAVLLAREESRRQWPVRAAFWRFVGWCGGPAFAASVVMSFVALALSLINWKIL